MPLDPDYERIEGSWKIVRSLTQGKVSEHAIGAIEIYEGTMFRWVHQGLESNRFTFQIDSAQVPKHIDVTSDEGTLHGIYELDGDQLTICFPEDDFAPRPTEFISTAETGWNLGVLERCAKT